MTYIEPPRSYSQRFKGNLREYRHNINIPLIIVALISTTMCYYILNYLLFDNQGAPAILTILSVLAVGIQGLAGIALSSIKADK